MPEDTKAKKPRSEKRLRKFQTLVRLNAEECAHLQRLCKITRCTPGVVMRALLMDKNLKPARVYPDEVYRAVIGLGRNWNQAVTKLHSTGQIPPEDVARLLEEVRMLCVCLSSRSTLDELSQN